MRRLVQQADEDVAQFAVALVWQQGYQLMHLYAQRRFFAAAFGQLVARVAHHLVLVLAVVAQLGRENQLVEERAHARHSRLQLVGRRGRLAETGLQAAADTGRDLLDLVGVQFGRRALELCDAWWNLR